MGIYEDGKFSRFTRWHSTPHDTLTAADGSRYSHEIARKTLDTSYVDSFLSAPALTNDEIKSEIAGDHHEPHKPDPELTAALLPLLSKMEKQHDEMLPQRERCLALRRQFSAANAKLGSTRGELSIALKSVPLETGVVAGRAYAIYGSNEVLDLIPLEQFTNLIVIFEEGRAERVMPVMAGTKDWRGDVCKSYFDFPRPPAVAAPATRGG